MIKRSFLKKASSVTLFFFIFICITGDTFSAREIKVPKDDENKSKKEVEDKKKKKQDEKKVIEKPAKKKKKKAKKFPILLVIGGTVVAATVMCLLLKRKPEGPPPDYGVGNPIFSFFNSVLIKTIKPEFNEMVSSEPTFVWEVTGQRYVFLGVFKNRIEVKDNRIINTNDNIWAWHSGLGRAREGSVYFSDGCDVINGELILDSPPTPLSKGGYYWAIWAWDDDGIKITHSSQEMYFIVE